VLFDVLQKYEEHTQHLIWDIHDTLVRRCLAAIRNLCRLTSPRNYRRYLVTDSMDFQHADYLHEWGLHRALDGFFTDWILSCVGDPSLPNVDKMKKQNKS
jgi:hypothetical protein